MRMGLLPKIVCGLMLTAGAHPLEAAVPADAAALASILRSGRVQKLLSEDVGPAELKVLQSHFTALAQEPATEPSVIKGALGAWAKMDEEQAGWAMQTRLQWIKALQPLLNEDQARFALFMLIGDDRYPGLPAQRDHFAPEEAANIWQVGGALVHALVQGPAWSDPGMAQSVIASAEHWMQVPASWVQKLVDSSLHASEFLALEPRQQWSWLSVWLSRGVELSPKLEQHLAELVRQGGVSLGSLVTYWPTHAAMPPALSDALSQASLPDAVDVEGSLPIRNPPEGLLFNFSSEERQRLYRVVTSADQDRADRASNLLLTSIPGDAAGEDTEPWPEGAVKDFRRTVGRWLITLRQLPDRDQRCTYVASHADTIARDILSHLEATAARQPSGASFDGMLHLLVLSWRLCPDVRWSPAMNRLQAVVDHRPSVAGEWSLVWQSLRDRGLGAALVTNKWSANQPTPDLLQLLDTSFLGVAPQIMSFYPNWSVEQGLPQRVWDQLDDHQRIQMLVLHSYYPLPELARFWNFDACRQSLPGLLAQLGPARQSDSVALKRIGFAIDALDREFVLGRLLDQQASSEWDRRLDLLAELAPDQVSLENVASLARLTEAEREWLARRRDQTASTMPMTHYWSFLGTKHAVMALRSAAGGGFLRQDDLAMWMDPVMASRRARPSAIQALWYVLAAHQASNP